MIINTLTLKFVDYKNNNYTHFYYTVLLRSRNINYSHVMDLWHNCVYVCIKYILCNFQVFKGYISKKITWKMSDDAT